MEEKPSSIIVLMVVLLVFCSWPNYNYNLLKGVLSYNNNVPAIFTFGDSIFDAGNNHFNKNCTAQADFPPYGSTFFHRPTGRFTNGRTVADFISQRLGIELQKPYLEVEIEAINGSTFEAYPSNGINFASAGSGVLNATNQDWGVTSTEAQVQQFQALVQQDKINKTLVQKSIILFESGSNDIYNYFLPFGTTAPSSSSLSPDAYVQAMLLQVSNLISHVYELGARRLAVFALGPVGCVPARAILPGAPVDRCYEEMNLMAEKYNKGLESLVNELTTKHPGMVGAFGDVYEIFQRFRATPSRYGFSDVTNACCGDGTLGGLVQCGKEGYKICPNPNSYLFWDYFHPSEHTYHLISKALWGGKRKAIRPLNLMTMAAMD